MPGTPAPFDVAIVGAGIAGLTSAFLLRERGLRPVVLEASSRAGGAISSHAEAGFLVERGPNTVLATHPEVGRLLDLAGLAGERIAASPHAKKRFIVRNGRPEPLPMSPGAFLGTPLFSSRAKLRLLAEPFVGRAPADSNETVAEFVVRRLGREFLDYAIDPFVSGVYAGRPERLAVRHAFPRLHEVEQRWGSLLVGQVRGAKERRARADVAKTEAGMFSLRAGLEALPRRLAERLGDGVRLSTPALRVAPREDGFSVDTPSGTVAARTLILASGVRDVVLFDGLGADVEALGAVDHPPLAVLSLGFRRADVAHPLDGFGLLVPRVEGRSILGALFPSTLFEGRAPAGHVLLTAFAGGARRPEVPLWDDERLRAAVVGDLEDLLGVRGEPVFEHVVRWPASIPQYDTAYGRVKETLDGLESTHPGLFFAGNSRSGISVPDTIRHAFATAERVATHLTANA